MPLNTSGKVSRIKESPVKAKLTDMGILEGREINVLFKAPLGDPIAISMGDYVLSVRKKEAESIEISTED